MLFWVATIDKAHDISSGYADWAEKSMLDRTRKKSKELDELEEENWEDPPEDGTVFLHRWANGSQVRRWR